MKPIASPAVVLTPATERHLWSICSKVPGVVYRSVEIASGRGRRDVAVVMDAWIARGTHGPMAVTTRLDSAKPDFEERLMEFCEKQMVRQRRLSEEGKAMNPPDTFSQASMSAALERRLWSMCSAVPGVVHRRLEVAAGSGPRDVVLEMEGWSPTLHACTITVTATLGHDCTPSGFEDAVAGLCEETLTRQRVREAHALALGMGLPPSPSIAGHFRDHLHADASALAAAIVDQARTNVTCPDCGRICRCGEVGEPTPDALVVPQVLEDTAGRLSLAHGGDRPYDGGCLIMSSGCSGYEQSTPNGILRCVDVRGGAVGRTPGGDVRVGTSKGETTLDVPADGIPETIIAALVGRSVDEVVAGDGPAWRCVARRRIASVRTRNSTLILVLAPALASFADLRDRSTAEALAHLEAVVEKSS